MNLTELTGPGGKFETAEEEVLGVRIPVMVNRRSTVGELLAMSTQWGDREYLVTEDRRITFAEHAGAAYSLAAALRSEYGVRAGDRVAILAANTPEWVISFWASQALGAITVGMNGWWVAPEIAYGLRHSTPTVVIADAKRAALLEQVDVGDTVVLTVEEDIPALIRRFSDASAPEVVLAEDDPAAILYTSGTTGRPKGVVHSQRNILAVADYHRFNDARMELAAGVGSATTKPRDRRYLLTSPLFHIASLHNLVIPRLATGSVVVMHQGSFDPARVLGLIERERVTNWGAVPTMVSRLLDYEGIGDFDLASLDVFATASAPSSPAFKERIREKLPFARKSMVDSYGLTECSTGIATANAVDLAARPGTLGRANMLVDMEIRDERGNRLPDGVEGEICTRSPYVMLGYWNDPDATAAAITPDRWLRTGDYGVIEDGCLTLTGRRSDLILRGGENVYPMEIEQVLDEVPGVRECAVVGVDHHELGQEVAAIVVVDPEANLTAVDLQRYAAEHLSYFKVPVHWRIVTDPLPRNATGKLMRGQILIPPSVSFASSPPTRT